MTFLNQRPRSPWSVMTLLAAAAVTAAGAARAEERRNHFNDPFVQATSSIRDCPVPEGPLVTQAEVRESAHVRAQHGTSCHLSGRCRLPNSYLYDAEIVPRVVQSIRRDGRFDDTSVWVLGQRRIVTLQGCVQSSEQAQELERVVGLVDDVMNVVVELMVGTQGKPRYQTAEDASE